MPAQNLNQDALISPPAETNDFGYINAGAAVHGSLAGENPRRNDGTSARVSAGPLLLGYARVSKADQRLNRQVEALRQAGCNRVFEDHGISGMKVSRPGLDELLTFARPGDAIVILDLDRLGRSTRHLLALIDDLRDRGIGLRILNLGVDTNTPAGQLVLTVMASIAALERAYLVDRVRSGLESAKRNGRVGGRPAALSTERREEVVRMKASGRTVAEIARLMVTSERTIRRVLAATAGPSDDG
jgi:DNA invertase Pin-like site-specific DNA recombinase